MTAQALFSDEKKTLYKGLASEAVKKFPVNINVAAALSIACEMDVEVDASSIEEARLIARALAADGIAEDSYSIGDFY